MLKMTGEDKKNTAPEMLYFIARLGAINFFTTL